MAKATHPAGIQDDLASALQPYWNVRHKVPGLLEDIDFLLFDWLLRDQATRDVKGDLLEIGAFQGKSAIVIGPHARDAEQFIVCDIFEDSTSDAANDEENADSYRDLTRRSFEDNYRRFVPRPATIVQELSTNIRDHVPDGTVRFAHVDGGHMYDVIKADVESISHLLVEGGIVAFDDFRAQHTPGVAAAVWEAVASAGLLPICVTDAKFYGTWSQPTADETRARLHGWLAAHADVRTGEQSVHGHPLLLVANPRIWTRRRRVRALLPPVVAERLMGRQEPHLGG